MSTKSRRNQDIADDAQNTGASDTRRHTHNGAGNLGLCSIELTGLQERFAQFVAAGNSASKAYRLSTDTSGMAAATIGRNAHTLAHLPQVAERVKVLKAAIAEKFVADEAAIRSALHHRQYQIAFAPALVQVRVFCCRHCNGTDNRFQWRGSGEYVEALERYAASLTGPKPLSAPADYRGGFEYDPFAKPSPTCPECRGAGVPVVYTPDTTELDAAGQLSFAGATLDARTGLPLIKQHDQQDAADYLAHMVPNTYAPKDSRSVVAHIAVDPTKPNPWSGRLLSPEQVLERIRASRAPVLTVESSPVEPNHEQS